MSRQDYKRVSIWHANDYNISLYIYKKFMTVCSIKIFIINFVKKKIMYKFYHNIHI